MVEMKHGEF